MSTILATAAVMVLSDSAHALVVETNYKKLDGGRADFGAGTHAFGSPQGNAVITWDYTLDNNNALVATARVRGTLYVDSLFGSACVRLTITYQGVSLVPLETQPVDLCGPGGDANNSANQKTVDRSFSSSELKSVVVAVNETLSKGTVVLDGASKFYLAPFDRTLFVNINSGAGDFGNGTHSFGGPDDDGRVYFTRAQGFFRDFDHLEGEVTGTLYYDSLFGSGCARVIVDFKADDGTNLASRPQDKCGPGGDANSTSNHKTIDETFDGFGLWQVRLRVGSLAGSSFVGVTSKTFNFNGEVGNFELQPSESTVYAHDVVKFALTWTVPEPLTWHALQALQVRIRDEAGAIMLLHWDEGTNTFSVFDAAAGRFKNGVAPGRPSRLETPHAALLMNQTSVTPVNSVLGVGPNSPGVTLNLALDFKPSAVGRTYLVEVAASDDQGHQDPFALAGHLTIDW